MALTPPLYGPSPCSPGKAIALQQPLLSYTPWMWLLHPGAPAGTWCLAGAASHVQELRVSRAASGALWSAPGITRGPRPSLKTQRSLLPSGARGAQDCSLNDHAVQTDIWENRQHDAACPGGVPGFRSGGSREAWSGETDTLGEVGRKRQVPGEGGWWKTADCSSFLTCLGSRSPGSFQSVVFVMRSQTSFL